MDNGIIRRGGKLPCPIDANGRFTEEVQDFSSQHVKVGRIFLYRILHMKCYVNWQVKMLNGIQTNVFVVLGVHLEP